MMSKLLYGEPNQKKSVYPNEQTKLKALTALHFFKKKKNAILFTFASIS